MGKASVIIYITVAIALLLLISRSSHVSKPHGRRSRRLKIRSNFTLAPPADLRRHHHDRPAAFDPLVADIELHREDREWEHQYFQTHHPDSTHPAPGHESQPEWEDFADAEDFLNDEERFNVTNRLVLLFPRIDIDPPDGFVSEPELTQWNLLQSQREALHRSQRELETHDKNKDGYVTFAEYEAPSWVRNADNTSFGYDIGWWKEDHFNASDVDGDGRLNITEFNDFLHPADTINPKLLLWLCNEEIRERDRDKDGKVNFNEFFHGLFDLVRDYEDTPNSSDESNDSLEAPAKVLFTQLDKDGDGNLSAAELLPIIGKLHPSEHHYARQQTDYILQQVHMYFLIFTGAISYGRDDMSDTDKQPGPSAVHNGLCQLVPQLPHINDFAFLEFADADKDGRLTLSEMIESPYVFYTAVFNEDEESDYELHDEFR